MLGPLGSNPQAGVTDQELHQLLLQPPVVLDDALESRERREGCRWAERQPGPTRLGECSPRGIWESKIPGRQTRPELLWVREGKGEDPVSGQQDRHLWNYS